MVWSQRLVSGWLWTKLHFGPAMARPKTPEILRASIGVALGILACGATLRFFLLEFPIGLAHNCTLVAPLGATAFLLMAVPNSPLAQPYSAFMGNLIAGIVGMGLAHLDLPLPLASALALGITVLLMMVTRSMHPPSAALALAAVMNAAGTRDLGLIYPLVPVALDTSLLILAAIAFNHLTGRVYPFRVTAVPAGPAPVIPAAPRLLPAADLDVLLAEMRLSANIGVEDLSRLFEAALTRASAQRFGALTAADVMTKDPLSVPPAMRVGAVSDLFSKTGFQSLPVVDQDRLIGLLTQADLIAHSREAAHSRNAMRGLKRIVRRHAPILVRDLMQENPQVVTPQLPFVTLIPMLADQHIEALPVVDQGRLVGLITRSNMIATLAREGIVSYANTPPASV